MPFPSIRRRGILLIASLILPIGCAPIRPSLAPSGPIVLAVVTWNMNAGRGDLPRLVADLTSGRLAGAPVADYVLLLQESIEGSRTDVTVLAQQRGLSAFFMPVRRSGERTSGNAILATRRLLNARPIDLPHERQPRLAVVATLDVRGERMFAVSAHLENRIPWLRGGLFSDTARGRQAAALLEALPAAGHGIVGGDMNTWLGPSEPALRSLTERFEDTPRDRPEPTFRDRLVLDHLFFDLPERWRAVRRVVPDRYGSDHHPVLGVVVETSG